jgi:pilus assembly protein CpaB
MDRGTRTFIVVAVAVVTAAGASASVYRAIRRIPVREVQVAHHFIVLAARPVPLGTRLTRGDVKVVAWPSDSPLPGAFSRADEVVGRGVVVAMAANEPLSDAKLAPRDAGAGLSPAIPAGMRAISVKVNEVIGVAGFVVPGARVDVVATVRRTDDAVSRLLIANVQVLTAGTRYDQEKPRDAKPIPSTVVTLVVSPAQAEKIALASAEGQLTLMLRNPLDVAEPSTAGAHLARLVDDDPAPVAVATTGVIAAPRKIAKIVKPEITPSPAVVEPAYTVEAIRSGKRTTEAILK